MKLPDWMEQGEYQIKSFIWSDFKGWNIVESLAINNLH